MKILIPLVSVFILSVSCSEDNQKKSEKLPELTTKGLGTFGCLVDGDVWLPRKLRYPLAGSLPKLEVFYSDDTGLLILTARRDYDSNIRREGIKIEIDSVFDMGTYDIKGFDDYIDYPPSSYFQIVFNDSSKMFSLNELSPNTISIVHLDTISQIVSGSFELTLHDSIGDEIIINNGIFDLNY